MKNLYSIDFNLTKHLGALLSFQNVSEAAKEVGVTQPAMSSSLSKLRSHFNDELLVRGKHGLIKTPLASELVPKVNDLLNQFEKTFINNNNFDPTKDKREFNIMISDSAAFVFAPVFLKHFMQKYPHIRLNFHPISENHSLDDLERTNAHLCLSSTLDTEIPQKLFTLLLKKDPLAVGGCIGYFKDKEEISFDDYLKADHYIVRPKGINPYSIDKALSNLKKKRKVTNTLSHFSMGINSVMNTCNMITLPMSVLKEASKFSDIKVFNLPFKMAPINHTLLWHEKYHKDEAHIWLRKELKSLVCSKPCK